jgi:hypothetical protein
MASALYTDVKKIHSKFIRPCEGQFGLVEWIVQGLPIEVRTLTNLLIAIETYHFYQY